MSKLSRREALLSTLCVSMFPTIPKGDVVINSSKRNCMWVMLELTPEWMPGSSIPKDSDIRHIWEKNDWTEESMYIHSNDFCKITLRKGMSVQTANKLLTQNEKDADHQFEWLTIEDEIGHPPVWVRWVADDDSRFQSTGFNSAAPNGYCQCCYCAFTDENPKKHLRLGRKFPMAVCGPCGDTLQAYGEPNMGDTYLV